MFLHHAYYAINNSIVLVLLAALIVHNISLSLIYGVINMQIIIIIIIIMQRLTRRVSVIRLTNRRRLVTTGISYRRWSRATEPCCRQNITIAAVDRSRYCQLGWLANGPVYHSKPWAFTLLEISWYHALTNDMSWRNFFISGVYYKVPKESILLLAYTRISLQLSVG